MTPRQVLIRVIGTLFYATNKTKPIEIAYKHNNARIICFIL